ncbi:MAG: allantoicase [Gemmatimonadota bacterium]
MDQTGGLSAACPWPDLAAERLGGRAVAANDEFFAPKENLLKPGRGIFIEDRYTDRGKWMDGWETRRRRTPGHDWCVVRLGVPGVVHHVVVDTNHFRGNHPERASLDAAWVGADHGEEGFADADLTWTSILPESPLTPHAENAFPVDDPRGWTHVRLNIYPDGGVARLRVHGTAAPDWARLEGAGEPVNLAATAHGGLVLGCSDRFFSAPGNLLAPGRGADMGDGWETRRRRGPGHDWVVIRLGRRGLLRRVEVDTAHFKGNFPESCSLEVHDAGPAPRSAEAAPLPDDVEWREGLPRAPLTADAEHVFTAPDVAALPATHVRFNIFPDGGVSRLRIVADLLPDAPSA